MKDSKDTKQPTKNGFVEVSTETPELKLTTRGELTSEKKKTGPQARSQRGAQPAVGQGDGAGETVEGVGVGDGVGVGGGGGEGLNRARAHEEFTPPKRHGASYVDADEVQPPNPEPARKAATRAHNRKVAATELANRLSDEWSVNGARVMVDTLGVGFVTGFLEYMNEARELGELPYLTNPGGFFVYKAHQAFEAQKMERREQYTAQQGDTDPDAWQNDSSNIFRRNKPASESDGPEFAGGDE